MGTLRTPTVRLEKLSGYEAVMHAIGTPRCKLFAGEAMREVATAEAMGMVSTPREDDVYTWRAVEL